MQVESNRKNYETTNTHLTLAIETSCDETSAAVVKNGRQILSNIISSQIQLHQKYGGVVPEIASRKHIENVIPVIDQALAEAKITLADINTIGVTYGPGLVGALLVGVAAAKALAFASNIPLVGVNHLEGHIFANFLAHTDLEPPFIALVVSGGHTSLIHLRNYDEFILLGQTRDDAAGEAFDKIARIMKFPYPGGPYIDQAAKSGNPDAIAFPRALRGARGEENYEFSFSGLKSAVLNYLNNAAQRGATVNISDVAASFQAAVVEVLVNKTMHAVQHSGVRQVVLAGGVAANSALRDELGKRAAERGTTLFYPPPVLCTDNAAMIACRAYYQYLGGDISDLNLNGVPGLRLGQ
ncbi:MAG TPA: tRNA (adenosine(37)-N6)-threonylcarbamoyltransferase complex transferase subunit TsaD [Methylomusa anaerophila]|uniref:tRNA N6-adenosine threonylcarbamoyltransferase n=1 Tax=Methylomusa anaerophila TaxID=1930071 RepID=A0A348AMK5_9FIRM|nr:tRNA (adenosine(37)-N6)-threonylcarbamoyltransferase complex transferase subunit TsaD [Methylomusa anaerophila]BBB92303.1 tRNA N6-adenosine threonylcarbamoyltransferase [Methylomusa anaerophila]HML90236.1 tRNA (adenosine(37)-N6)-threonylcarbamoyltransferase complex transferase subunit TsaD [Methylomusa anaerophila]